jgi:hypothetical protein
LANPGMPTYGNRTAVGVIMQAMEGSGTLRESPNLRRDL